jgi:hypothetical protein
MVFSHRLECCISLLWDFIDCRGNGRRTYSSSRLVLCSIRVEKESPYSLGPKHVAFSSYEDRFKTQHGFRGWDYNVILLFKLGMTILVFKHVTPVVS